MLFKERHIDTGQRMLATAAKRGFEAWIAAAKWLPLQREIEKDSTAVRKDFVSG